MRSKGLGNLSKWKIEEIFLKLSKRKTLRFPNNCKWPLSDENFDTHRSDATLIDMKSLTICYGNPVKKYSLLSSVQKVKDFYETYVKRDRWVSWGESHSSYFQLNLLGKYAINQCFFYWWKTICDRQKSCTWSM